LILELQSEKDQGIIIIIIIIIITNKQTNRLHGI
jgi:hypothetical protein